MDRDDIRIKAARARALMGTEAFTDVVADLRGEMTKVFLNTKASEIEAREEAHAIVRALGMVEQLLQADIDAEKMLDRKQKGSAP